MKIDILKKGALLAIPFSLILLILFLNSTLFLVPVNSAPTPTPISKYGKVCISTTGNFDGRSTIPHSGINELVNCEDNLVVNQGLNATRDIIGQGTRFGAFDFIGLCNATAGCSTPAANDVNLENEYTTNGLTRAQGTYTTLQISAGNWSIYNTFTSSGVANLQTNKTCLFNQSSSTGDTMFACNTFSLVTLDGTAGDTLTVNWTNFVTSG